MCKGWEIEDYNITRYDLSRSLPVAHWWKGSASEYSEGHRRASDTYTDTVESFEPTPIAHLPQCKCLFQLDTQGFKIDKKI